MTTPAEIHAWLTEQIGAILTLPEDEIDPDATFDSFGLASRDAVSLSGDLEDYLNRRLSPTLLYQYPTINQLANHLGASEPGAQPGPNAPAPGGPPAEPERLSDAEVAAMSEEEAEAALLRKLLDMEK